MWRQSPPQKRRPKMSYRTSSSKALQILQKVLGVFMEQKPRLSYDIPKTNTNMVGSQHERPANIRTKKLRNASQHVSPVCMPPQHKRFKIIGRGGGGGGSIPRKTYIGECCEGGEDKDATGSLRCEHKTTWPPATKQNAYYVALHNPRTNETAHTQHNSLEGQ